MQLAAVTADRIDPASALTWTAADRAVLARVEPALAAGRALRQWWEQTDAAGGYAERFELIRAFNRPDTSFGFFDRAAVGAAPLPVLGVVEDLLYDQPQQATAADVRDQLREFVLHYFLRASDFRQPSAAVESSLPPPTSYLPGLSWCPTADVSEGGFGFAQHYYKLRDSGRVGKFPAHEEPTILDLRDVAARYEWVVLRVQIFDFNVRLRPLGPAGPQLVVPLQESSYLVLSPDFVADREKPTPGTLAEYGFGYAFIKGPDESGPVAYGPGRFDAAFQLITFRVLDDGEIRVRLAFVANRPGRIADVTLDPLTWGYRAAGLLSLGLTTRLFAPLKGALDRLPLRVGGIDPVRAYIAAANFLTGGGAARELCVSTERLEKAFLVQHFMQHYQMITGSLLTWRQVYDWLDAASLPDWVVKGEGV